MAVEMETETAPGPSRQRATGEPPPRIESVDLLRGAVMVLMVLDHARDYIPPSRVSPTDLSATTPGLFLTRWVTHVCAPAFVFLAGTGVFLAATRGKSRPELSRFLITRGLWLVLLELTVVRLGMTFTLDYQYMPAGVLWAIGWSMVALAGLIWLPMPVVAGFGLVVMLGHNLLDPIEADALGRWRPLWILLHEQGTIHFGRGVELKVIYPLVPWIGVMAAGYAFGAFLRRGLRRQRQLLFVAGVSLIGMFLAVRAANVYGDPNPWSVQGRPLYTAFSFVDCKKYPPSALFLLMTLGPAILALGFLDGMVARRLQRPLVTLGRVPLFYYLLQWPLVHALALGAALATGRPWRWLVASRPFDAPPGAEYSLPMVYAMWLVAVALLFPASTWFAGLKERRRDWRWLSYF